MIPGVVVDTVGENAKMKYIRASLRKIWQATNSILRSNCELVLTICPSDPTRMASAPESRRKASNTGPRSPKWYPIVFNQHIYLPSQIVIDHSGISPGVASEGGRYAVQVSYPMSRRYAPNSS